MKYPQNIHELFNATGTRGDILNMANVEKAIKKYSEMVKEKIEPLKKTNSLTYTRTGNADFTSPDFTIAATGIGTVNDENC